MKWNKFCWKVITLSQRIDKIDVNPSRTCCGIFNQESEWHQFPGSWPEFPERHIWGIRQPTVSDVSIQSCRTWFSVSRWPGLRCWWCGVYSVTLDHSVSGSEGPRMRAAVNSAQSCQHGGQARQTENLLGLWNRVWYVNHQEGWNPIGGGILWWNSSYLETWMSGKTHALHPSRKIESYQHRAQFKLSNNRVRIYNNQKRSLLLFTFTSN